MKKIFLIIFLGSLTLPLITSAGTYIADGKEVSYEGLVPCGKSVIGPEESPEVTMPCQFCHLFVMIDGIVDFVLFKLIPPIAVLMLVIGGVMFFLAAGSPERLQTARRLLTAVIIGLVIVYGAWVFINLFFSVIGLSEFGLELTGPDRWAEMKCEI